MSDAREFFYRRLRSLVMRRRSLAALFAVLLTLAASAPTLAASDGAQEDTDVRKVDAKVVEVNDRHISIVARTGVEHVIATDAADTHVTLKGKRIDMKRLRVGDVVTVDLDAANPLKFARRIIIGEQAGETQTAARD
jgi:ABC-type enterochelin transport system substrate-binding protein